MPDAAPLDHPAVKALLDLTPSMPVEMVTAAAALRGEFGFRTDNLPQSQTLLCVGRCRDDDGEQITVVTRSSCGDLVVHTCFDNEDDQLYGYNTYQDPASMVRKMDESMEEGQTWCGAYERELFGRLAADRALPRISGEDIVLAVTDEPGQTLDHLLREVTDLAEIRRLRYEVVPKLIEAGRISVVRFTTYAPTMVTTSLLFGTENGRLEIIGNKQQDFCGFQIAHVHDPMGLWDERMAAAD